MAENTIIFVSSGAKKRLLASLIINAVIFVLEIVGLILSIQAHGAGLFQFYTQDSNILAMLACGACVVAALIGLKKKSTAPPVWIKLSKYMATCCLAVTFLVVIFVLCPTYGPGSMKIFMFSGSMLYHHLICPILALLSFIFLEPEPPLQKKHVWFAMIPTALYAAVALVLNVARLMDGPYPFLHVYEQPVYLSIVWFVVILGGAWFMSWLILLANRRWSRRLEPK